MQESRTQAFPSKNKSINPSELAGRYIDTNLGKIIIEGAITPSCDLLRSRNQAGQTFSVKYFYSPSEDNQQFRNEIEKLRYLHNPNIITFFSCV
jgi:hypothetical protein